jgi:uncharacterized protein YndB with AHSA1/START domain
MWKWIVGGCFGLIVIVCVLMYISWQKVKSIAGEGPTVTATIGAPIPHVFAAMSNLDSMRLWRLEGTMFRATQHGLLQPGDTLAGETSNSQNQVVWVVSAVAPDTVIAFDGVMKTDGRRMFTRRDSVSAVGDSTRVTTSFTVSLPDTTNSGKRMSGALSDFAMTAMTTGFRVQMQEELKRLKNHVEGKSATPAAPAKKP